MLAGSILLGVEARLAKTDAMLLLTIVAAMGALARAYLGRVEPAAGSRAAYALPAIFWTALAAGMLFKGPVILLFVGLTAVTARDPRPIGALVAGAAARARRCRGCCVWCCRGSSRS